MNNEVAIIVAMVVVIVLIVSVIAATNQSLDFANESMGDIREELIEQNYYDEYQKEESKQVFDRGERSWKRETHPLQL